MAYAYSASGVANPTSRYLSTVDSRFVDTALARFHYVQAGTGSPVVLVHGGGEWAYSYRNSIGELARTHTVYAVDLPGHGYTTLHKGGFRFDLPSMTDSLAVFLDALGLRKVSLVGHSWGGGWALRFAETRPERVDKLALIDSSGLQVEDTWDWRMLEYPVLGELMMNLATRDNMKPLLLKAFHEPSRVIGDQEIDEYWAPASQPTARSAMLSLQRNQDWSISEHDLSLVRAQTLVLWGSDDVGCQEKGFWRGKRDGAGGRVGVRPWPMVIVTCVRW
ncbi:alpha/beta fold hydrolase [Nocardia sp. GAS34]|uniref:alpha/beta fold hydrolase n=1 Tax=unclassified Nocardia TaxID=2637762 RepID=UPI003D223FCC